VVRKSRRDPDRSKQWFALLASRRGGVAFWRKHDKASQCRARCRTTFQRFAAIAFAGRIATLADVGSIVGWLALRNAALGRGHGTTAREALERRAYLGPIDTRQHSLVTLDKYHRGGRVSYSTKGSCAPARAFRCGQQARDASWERPPVA